MDRDFGYAVYQQWDGQFIVFMRFLKLQYNELDSQPVKGQSDSTP